VKLTALDKALSKVLDLSVNSVGAAELDECFGALKGQFGGTLQKLFMNMIAKTQSNMEGSYKDICIRRDLEEKLKELEQVAASLSSSSSSSSSTGSGTAGGGGGGDVSLLADPLLPSMMELKRREMEDLKIAIKHMETDMKKQTETAGRLKAQINNEIAAATEEGQKLILAASQCKQP